MPAAPFAVIYFVQGSNGLIKIGSTRRLRGVHHLLAHAIDQWEREECPKLQKKR